MSTESETVGMQKISIKGRLNNIFRPMLNAFKTPAGKVGLPLVILHLLLACFGSFLAPFGPTDFSDETFAQPFTMGSGNSIPYILGTDQFGRDVFSRLLSGARSIILISAIGSILVWYLLSALGFDFNRGLVGGISGAMIGSWVSSYLNKKK